MEKVIADATSSFLPRKLSVTLYKLPFHGPVSAWLCRQMLFGTLLYFASIFSAPEDTQEINTIFTQEDKIHHSQHHVLDTLIARNPSRPLNFRVLIDIRPL